MSKMLGVRLDPEIARQVEKVRDPARFPTQSDFVREALKRMIREERRRRVAAEIDQLMKDRAYVAEAQALAESSRQDLANHLAALERGEE
ncbi:MAG: hypothetical protein HY675_15310 [Chloroflexi bacterium]|nr:hypothetical protein [Chloroflexota bacterium]